MSDSKPRIPESKLRMWRSEPMQLIQILVQREISHDTLLALGEMKCLQFIDLNRKLPIHEREFTTMALKCAELERQLRYIRNEIETSSMDIPEQQTPADSTVTELGIIFSDYEHRLTELKTQCDVLTHEYVRLAEARVILTRGSAFFDETSRQAHLSVEPDAREDDAAPFLEYNSPNAVNAPPTTNAALCSLMGAIDTPKLEALMRLVFRATRGNSFIRHLPLEDDEIAAPTADRTIVPKSVFIILFSSSRARDDLKRICDSLDARTVVLPDPSELEATVYDIEERLGTVTNVLQSSQSQFADILQEAAPYIDDWSLRVNTEATVYHTLNMLGAEHSDKCLLARAWCPVDSLPLVHEAVAQCDRATRADVPTIVESIETKASPPTYFRTNKFTKAFQGISDAYGQCTYGEVNPGMFYLFTYPFLFAVMFGDVMHGSVVLLMALLMIWKEKPMLKNGVHDALDMIFKGRYVILLLGIFSMIVGLIYNEYFGLPIPYPDSPYTISNHEVNPTNIDIGNLHFKAPVFGMDYNWRTADAGLAYVNSFKMKVSIIIGILHMYAGIAFSVFNFVRNRDYLNIFCKAIPEILFLTSTFGYLAVCIVIKWCTSRFENGRGPSLTRMLIGLFMSPGSVEDDAWLYPGQTGVQLVLFVIILISVPWLLFPKGVILLARLLMEKQREKKGHTEALLDEVAQAQQEESEQAEEGVGEIIVDQVIHTIEYCLGCISHTASYLRLWALSLAHGELSEVFFSQLIGKALSPSSTPVKMFILPIVWAAWAAASFLVLCIMESLSAFLHALRLHWVEHQSKYFEGEGYKFRPLQFSGGLPLWRTAKDLRAEQ
ncbi:V-type ATPase, V0 complex, 116kDa subunit family [Carpediemonas membranifera]|uniref:V-type proton ATPase subunit a n=1 Tax=Carpediemonas membranifera TaxID=201153 RepID=A0A8J6B2U4_9EUKA|nr:V-type ATPase, V0 complex, 116kDa subunit family [Carpediemonas membranifera]|eukprot:KAG9391739.1 V-type ATPase, V0 complex, 116kDa subunit family [Carpediemonas membranifera]